MITPLMTKIREVSLLQYAVAAKTGITESRLSRLANGHSTPKPEEVRVLARVLRCKPEEIFPA